MTQGISFSRMLILSVFFHFACLILLSVPLKKHAKKIDLFYSYSVNLVTSIEEERQLSKALEEAKPHGAPTGAEKTQIEKRPAKKINLRTTKQKPVTEKSLSVSKEIPTSPTKDELSSLEERIKELKAKTQYLSVGQSENRSSEEHARGMGISQGGGSSIPLDSSTQAYIALVWNRVKKAWGVPGGLALRKDLETIVVVKIRKDGRIVDLNVEKRSGNRIYDESVLRTLRVLDPFPPFPQSITGEYLEIGFRFLPGDLS